MCGTKFSCHLSKTTCVTQSSRVSHKPWHFFFFLLWQIKFCSKRDVCVLSTTGARSYIFTSPGICKKRREDPFLLPKVKVEFRHLFSLQKRFSLCSYHNINANIVAFYDWLVYSGITLVFEFQAVWTTSYHTHFRFIRT